MHGIELYDRLQELLGNDYEYVLHGTDVMTDILEPRLPVFDHENRPELSECAVYGTFLPEIAIFYALIREEKNDWGWSPNVRDSTITLVVPDSFRGSPGYLYILPSKPFVKSICGGLCAVAYEPIKPVEVLEVHPKVLEYIQVKRGVSIETTPRALDS